METRWTVSFWRCSLSYTPRSFSLLDNDIRQKPPSAFAQTDTFHLAYPSHIPGQLMRLPSPAPSASPSPPLASQHPEAP